MAIRIRYFLRAFVLLQCGLVMASAYEPTGAYWSLAVAAQENDLAKAEVALQDPSVDINFLTDFGTNPLLNAVGKNHYKMAQFLLERNADANVRADNASAPLSVAVASGYYDMVNLLVENGANANQANKYGTTPLSEALRCRQTKLAQLLTEHGAILGAAGSGGRTLLHIAAEQGDYAGVKQFIESEDVNKRMDDGATALLLAAGYGHLNVVQLLIERGANVNLAMENGATALLLAAKYGHLNVVQLLIEKGANVNLAMEDGTTPLLMTAIYGEEDVAALLIENGAQLFAPEDLNAPEERIGPLICDVLAEGEMRIDEVATFMSTNEVRSVVPNLGIEHKQQILKDLLRLEYGREGRASMGPVIADYEALSGVKRTDVQKPCENPWYFIDLLNEKGIDAVRAEMGQKALVGIVTVSGLLLDDVIAAAETYQSEHDQSIVFMYANRDLLKAIGVQNFSGLIFPGADDNYPREVSEFTLQAMPEPSRTEIEKLYQFIYAEAMGARVPTFGICAGAQHLVLNRGGALTQVETIEETIKLDPFHVPHYMSLSPEAKQRALATCEAPDVSLEVYRNHTFAAVESRLGDSLVLGSKAEGTTPMAVYRGLQNIGVQFHPEVQYVGIGYNDESESNRYQTQLLNSFFDLCLQQHAFLEWASFKGLDREDALNLRDSINRSIVKRLDECRQNPDAAKKPWGGATNFTPADFLK